MNSIISSILSNWNFFGENCFKLRIPNCKFHVFILPAKNNFGIRMLNSAKVNFLCNFSNKRLKFS